MPEYCIHLTQTTDCYILCAGPPQLLSLFILPHTSRSFCMIGRIFAGVARFFMGTGTFVRSVLCWHLHYAFKIFSASPGFFKVRTLNFRENLTEQVRYL